MTTETLNIERQLRVATIEVLDMADPATREEWLRVRDAYIQSQHWDASDVMGDSYDAIPETRHLVARHPETREIIAGMRLTPMADVEASLSWSMLSPQMQAEAKRHLPELETGNMWDLTRLITNPDLPRSDKMMAFEAVYALLGTGQEYTVAADGTPPRWFFTTTLDFLETSGEGGITFHELARGIIPNPRTGDEEPLTAFCYADPTHETHSLEESTDPRHKRTLRAVQRGIGTAAAYLGHERAA